jgi:hypothetical protein
LQTTRGGCPKGLNDYPIVASLPSSPVEGQMVIYKNTSASWTRLAVYINRAWRMSANL